MVNHGDGPTCSALNCSMSKTRGLSPEGKQISTAWPGADTLMFKMVTFCTAARHVLHCLLWLKVVGVITSYAEPMFLSSRRSQPCTKIGIKHIHQAAFKHLLHVLWSYNEFNTLLSAVLMIQSRDFPVVT